MPAPSAIGPVLMPWTASAPGEPRSPVLQRAARFTLQSFLDSTRGARALLSQPTNRAIVESTLTQEQIQGYGITLHPSSETPVAVEFQGQGTSGSSGVIAVRPGMTVRPQGRPDGRPNPFAGFRWGLPFGWLGGGLAGLLVHLSPDAAVDAAGQSPEVLFHRVRLLVIADQALPLPAAVPNWPLRFPWPNAQRDDGAGNLTYQKGQPVLAIVEPTRIVMRLRVTAPLAANATMRMVWRQADSFDNGGAADPPTLNTVDTTTLDVSWPSTSGLSNLAFPMVTLAGPEVLLGGDSAEVKLLDLTGTLAGLYVDILRYGRL